MSAFHILAPGLVVLATTMPGEAVAQVASHTHQELPEHGDPGGALSFELAYTADVWRNEGGLQDGTRYLDNLDLVAQLDLEQAIGWQGATAQAYVLYNGSASLSELTGDAQVVSNIETGVRVLRLYEMWIEAPLTQGASLKAGLYDLNSEFDALETSSLFLGSAHGIGTDIAQSGENGPSIFPSTSLAARLQLNLAENVALRLAVLDGVPGDPVHPRRTAVKLGDGDGALLITELDVGQEDSRIIAGTWRYTNSFDTHDALSQGRSYGYYLRGEAELARLGESSLRGFFRLGMASGHVNAFSNFASTGLTFQNGLGNSFGVALARAGISNAFRRANPGVGSHETVLELTYAHQVAPWLQIQPNLQWVLNPSADPATDNAVAFGLRITVTP